MKLNKLLLIPFLLLTSCDGTERKTPLQWCIWEIHNQENYDCEWSYIYSDIKNHDDSYNHYLHAYYITTFTDDRIGEWYCYVEREEPKNFFGKMFELKTYSLEEIITLDCDLVREQLI